MTGRGIGNGMGIGNGIGKMTGYGIRTVGGGIKELTIELLSVVAVVDDKDELESLVDLTVAVAHFVCD